MVYGGALHPPKPLGIRAVLWYSLPQTRQPPPPNFLIEKKKSSCPKGKIDENFIFFPKYMNARRKIT